MFNNEVATVVYLILCYSLLCGLGQNSTNQTELDEEYLFDFTKHDDVDAWQEQSDTVRDVGMSKAVLVIHKNMNYRRAIFFALLNPQLNGAGFAGIRAIQTYNLTGYTKFQIKCRGQGQFNGFKVVLRHKGLNDEPNYSFEQYFQAPKDEFAIRNLSFSEFKPYYRGKRVNNETLDISQVTSLGIQMYGGVYQPVKQKGPATLEIDWIKADNVLSPVFILVSISYLYYLVLFTRDLHFRKHISNICKQAYRNLGFILRQANEFTNICAVKALYEALVKSHLEHNAAIWSPSETKYSAMVERIQNKYTRFIYLKLYGVYPGYPLLYQSLFVLGMVGYYKLGVRREVTLATYLFKLLRGRIQNPPILSQISFCIPNDYIGRRRRPPLLVVPRARTNLLHRAPLTRALRALNAVADVVDIFTCSLSEFTKVTYRVLSDS